MDYFRIIHLIKEPFSNSPDPEYFFQSCQHVECLQKLELSLRLRRGLNVVIGEVGTGKTTLCRQLIRKFAAEKDCETHLVLDPYFSSSSEFLRSVAEMLTGEQPPAGANDWQLKEIIKKYIFRKGVDENRIVILIIDEGQKIPDFCLEILREFLNFETNDYKLLQIAIFAQKEFENTLETYSNFADRISLYHTLGPLSFKDTRQMIRFRIRQSSETPRPPAVFTLPALWMIYRASGGYPRKIVNLCHRSIMAMIIQNRTRAGWLLVRSCVKRSFSEKRPKWQRAAVTGLIMLAVIVSAAGLLPTRLNIADLLKNRRTATPGTHQAPVAASVPQVLEPPRKESAMLPDQTKKPDSGRVASIEAVPKAVAQPLEDKKRIPSLLGRVALKQNETLWRLIEKVYGEFSYPLQKLLLAANPQIRDPNQIEAGSLISVPAIAVSVKPLTQAVWWIKLEDRDRIDEAIQTLRSYPDTAPPIRMVPNWRPAGNIRFSILLREYFYNETAARGRLAGLPPVFSEKVEILTGWEEGTVFFADPYLVMK
ncbi:MAG: AAA family ATPase [Thermodesulfobacteriota bacterium]